MKAILITLTCVNNYGSQLQAFATQEKLKEVFDDVELIDYYREDTHGKGLIKRHSKGNKVKALIYIPSMLKSNQVFNRFKKEYLNLSIKRYYDDSDYTNFNVNGDVFFTGSDQIWNYEWNMDVIPVLYLDFVEADKLKIAISSSFGRNTISQEEVEKTKHYIEKFDMISVREKSGVDILKEDYKINCVRQLSDPVFSMPSSYWREHAINRRIRDDGYILIYCLRRNRKIDKYAKILSKKTGLKIYRICSRYDQIILAGRKVFVPEVFEFVSLIDNAKYVITDSFHALAFSLILNTIPICIFPEKYSCRLSETLEKFNLEKCHIKKEEDLTEDNLKIDFKKVNRILSRERDEADTYYRDIQKMVEEYKKNARR